MKPVLSMFESPLLKKKNVSKFRYHDNSAYGDVSVETFVSTLVGTTLHALCLWGAEGPVWVCREPQVWHLVQALCGGAPLVCLIPEKHLDKLLWSLSQLWQLHLPSVQASEPLVLICLAVGIQSRHYINIWWGCALKQPFVWDVYLPGSSSPFFWFLQHTVSFWFVQSLWYWCNICPTV